MTGREQIISSRFPVYAARITTPNEMEIQPDSKRGGAARISGQKTPYGVCVCAALGKSGGGKVDAAVGKQDKKT